MMVVALTLNLHNVNIPVTIIVDTSVKYEKTCCPVFMPGFNCYFTLGLFSRESCDPDQRLRYNG